MKLYVYPLSPNARKVLLVAKHLELEPEVQLVDLQAGDQHDSAYAALNPNELMPTLVDGDFVLWESNAIMQYLASRAPGQTLWPSEPRAQASVSRWQFWQASHWGPACGTLTFERMVKPFFGDPEGPDPQKVAEAEEQFLKYGRVLDRELAGRNWLVGEGLTLADISVAVYLTYAGPAGMPVDDFPEVCRWFAAVQELPAWQATEPQIPAPA